MKKFHILSGMVAISLIMSSCVTTKKKSAYVEPTYEEPLSGPVSKVRFVTTTDNLTNIYQYDDRKCTNEKQIFSLTRNHTYNTTKRNLGMPFNNYNNNSAKEVYVQAGTETVSRFSSIVNVRKGRMNFKYNCQHMFGYEFKEGKEYEVRFIMSSLDTLHNSKSFKYRCGLELYGIEYASGEPQMELLKSFKPEDLNTRGCNRVMYPEFQK